MGFSIPPVEFQQERPAYCIPSNVIYLFKREPEVMRIDICSSSVYLLYLRQGNADSKCYDEAWSWPKLTWGIHPAESYKLFFFFFGHTGVYT